MSGNISIKSFSYSVISQFKCITITGKIEVVAPNSVPILVIVLLSVTLNVDIPGPENSNTLSTPPLTLNIFNKYKIISLAETKGFNRPLK